MTDLTRRFAAIALTIVFSSLCLVGAVGPAQSSIAPATSTTRVA